MDLIELVGAPAVFDDLTFLGRLGVPSLILAVPRDQGTLFAIDSRSLEVTRIDGLPLGVASAAGGSDHFFLADRSGESVVVVDIASGSIASTFALAGTPDYVRYTPLTNEVWVTEPKDDRIETLSVASDGSLAHAGFVQLSGSPEGLAFDPVTDRAFTHLPDGELAAIDLRGKRVLDVWKTGCADSHGIPAVNGLAGLVFAGCSSRGGGVLLDAQRGVPYAGLEVGTGEAVLAYSTFSNEIYLRGDPGEDLAILRPCQGGLALNATVKIPPNGHAMVGDAGYVWIADADRGGILRLGDPFILR